MLRAAVFVLLMVLLPAHARAEARIALLVGTQAYDLRLMRFLLGRDVQIIVLPITRHPKITVTALAK